MAHELVMLSAYRYPAQHALTLADDDMAAWLNAFTALWHPALLWQAASPPRCESPYDHEQPRPNVVYAVPETPPSYLPDDWDSRVLAAGGRSFRATPDRAATLANLRTALQGEPAIGWREGLELGTEEIGPFFGLGWGHVLLAALSEAMEHENLLEPVSFWEEVQAALALRAGFQKDPHPGNGDQAPPSGDWREPLRRAAAKLQVAREVLYPVAIHLLDIVVREEKHLDLPWPPALELGTPLNVIAATATLEQMAERHPELLGALRRALEAGRAEVCGGSYLERADPLLPIDSQLWNLRAGLEGAQRLLGTEVRVYARHRFGFHPQTPLLLTSNGITKALLLTFDAASGLPHYNSPVVSWPSPDGRQVEAFARAPKPADSPETFFNLGHSWFKTTREDQTATLVVLHAGKPAVPWYRDILELDRLAPVLGTWTTFSGYFAAATPGEYPPLLSADDFHSDFLSERVEAQQPAPVSGFARHWRQRRRVDACWTYAALQRALAGRADAWDARPDLQRLEDALETSSLLGATPPALSEIEDRLVRSLAERLQSRAAVNQPGYLVLNPCGFARRTALELEPGSRPLAVESAVKACQLDSDRLRLVVEVPALGFLWLPREGPPGTQAMPARRRLADATTLSLRNEFLEVEVDPATGGVRAIRDPRTHGNRLGQQLVFNPGSRMVASTVKVTSTGPALGEIVSEGALLGDQGQVLANYRQRLRVWLARPLLEMRVELQPQQPPAGYAWHAYYGSRFAWRDERETLVRGVGGMSFVTTHPRPQTPSYLEIRQPPNSNTVILPGGLPFHQRQGGRMVDVILMPEGEKETTFDIGIALDRDIPMQTALGYASPLAVVPTNRGAPHVGASGWLFHVDAPNLLLTRLVPGTLEVRADGEKAGVEDAVTARFLECAGYSGLAEFRCVRDPKRAVALNARGDFVLQPNVTGDAVHLEVSPNDLVQVQVEFS